MDTKVANHTQTCYNLIMEEWRKIPGYPCKYQVSSLGRIRFLGGYYITTCGIDTRFKGKTLVRWKPAKTYALKKSSPKGYQRINLCGKVQFVHRLVMLAFIPNPTNLPQSNHKNGIKTDNRVENLEWVTNQENRDHAVKYGLQPRGSKISKRLVETDIPIIRSLSKSGIYQKEIAVRFGVCQQTISHIVRHNTWTHI